MREKAYAMVKHAFLFFCRNQTPI